MTDMNKILFSLSRQLPSESNGRRLGAVDLPTMDFDFVITVCGHAHETCPYFPGKARVVHVGFDDPPRLAKGAKTEEEALSGYRLAF